MKLFQTLIVVASVMVGTQVALAEEGAVERYTYGSHPDIAKVVSQDPIPNVCGVVPVRMTYLDYEGKEHTMEYSVMGNGCHDN